MDDGEDELYSPDEIVSYLLDLVSGLEFLHQQNIIHRLVVGVWRILFLLLPLPFLNQTENKQPKPKNRDLKSDNVFVTLNERKEIATLAIGDFDTAKALSEEGPAKTLVGTPAYMAPEVLAQNGAYSLQADGLFCIYVFFEWVFFRCVPISLSPPYFFQKKIVYSFGMVIYELLALQMPYSNSPPFKVQANILQGIAVCSFPLPLPSRLTHPLPFFSFSLSPL